MRLRSRQWLTRREWKQLAPDDAYLSCEYFLPARTREKRRLMWLADYDVRCELYSGKGAMRDMELISGYSDKRGCRYVEERLVD